jgi:hypothetical protein
MMDVESSFNYDKEQMLEAMVAASGMTPEEFGVDWLIEEYPVEILKSDNFNDDDYIFTVRQEFRARLKTPEEKQLAIESEKK